MTGDVHLTAWLGQKMVVSPSSLNRSWFAPAWSLHDWFLSNTFIQKRDEAEAFALTDDRLVEIRLPASQGLQCRFEAHQSSLDTCFLSRFIHDASDTKSPKGQTFYRDSSITPPRAAPSRQQGAIFRMAFSPLEGNRVGATPLYAVVIQHL